MKNDGRLRRNWLKGAHGDAFNALLCGCGHNLRMILRPFRQRVRRGRVDRPVKLAREDFGCQWISPPHWKGTEL